MHFDLMSLLAQRAGSAKGGANVVFAEVAFLNTVPLTNLLSERSVDDA